MPVFVRISKDRLINLDQVLDVQRQEKKNTTVLTFEGPTDVLIGGIPGRAIFEYLIGNAHDLTGEDDNVGAQPKPASAYGPGRDFEIGG